MGSNPTSIFRQEALEYRARQQGRQVRPDMTLPRLMRRRAWTALWALLATLVIGAMLACLPSVPVHATGLAVAGDSSRVAVLAPGDVTGIQPGADVTIRLGERELSGTVAAVEPEPMEPAEAAQRLDLPWSAVSMLTGPVTVAWIEPETTDVVTPGLLGRAVIDIGSRAAGSYLPLVGQLFRSDS